MSKVLNILLIFLVLLILTTCAKKEESGDSNASSSSAAACRGRINGVKDSSSTLTNLKFPFPKEVYVPFIYSSNIDWNAFWSISSPSPGRSGIDIDPFTGNIGS